MSDFCGFIGKSENDTLNLLVKNLHVKNLHVNATKNKTDLEPVCFDDGFIHLAYVPYTAGEQKQIGHNDDFTVWVMMDVAGMGDGPTAQSVIASYEKKGLSVFEELEGTFSVVLWDCVQKKLYLIRDRFGAKQLYYARCGEGLVFGTNLNVILQYPGYENKMNLEALYQYMSFQSVYLPYTAFEGVCHVNAGCVGTYYAGNYEEKSYDDTPFGNLSEDSYEEAVEKITGLLKQSVNQSVTENAGIFLSGGLDSSLVCALAETGKIQKSFCLKPITEENSIHRKADDVKYAELLAREYGLEHTTYEMRPKELADNVRKIIESFGQPFSGTMSTYFLAEKVSKECKNILTGDGADELFGSYRHHSVLMPMEKYIHYRKNGQSIVGKESEFVPYDENIAFLDSLYNCAGASPTEWHYKLLQMEDAQKELFLNPERFYELIRIQKTRCELTKWDNGLKSKGVLNRSLERDFKYLLPGHTMLYQETLAKNHQIRLIMPFMNSNLAKYVVTLPQDYKIRRGKTKAILRETGRKVLPEDIVNRRKEPFSLPITEWLRTDLKEYLTDVLSPASVKRHGLFNEVCVEYALSEFYKHSGSKDYYGQMLWTMAMLSEWADIYF